MTPNGRVHRLLTRLAVDLLFHPSAFMFGQKSLAPKMALLHKIPLVITARTKPNMATRLVIPTLQNGTGHTSPLTTNRRFSSVVFRSPTEEPVRVEHQDLLPYLPADPQEIERQKVEVHYLGYYLKWHPQSCYYYAV